MDQSRSIADDSSEFAGLPLAVVMEIDQLADEFESAHRSGAAPSLDDFKRRLSSGSDAARAALESHLQQILVDIGTSAAEGQTPTGAAAQTPGQHRPTQMPPRLPQLSEQTVAIGEYRVLEQLASGGMGVVYKALHTRLERYVAIKFPRFAVGLDRSATARFLREARLVGRLTHPHIVRALDAGESEYGPYLVTEFIDGETVDAKVRRAGPLTLEEAVTLIVQAARALAHAHAHGVIHRDVKPSNMLLDADGVLRVVDFGLGKLLADERSADESSEAADHTEHGAFLGTVGYAAPEQLHAGRAVDHRADIYSLGCVLYFMLTGKPPHKGTLADRLAASSRSSSPTLRHVRGGVPAEIEKTWQRMMASSPEQRLATMAEVEQAFASRAAGSRPVSHPSPSRRTALATAACLVASGLAIWAMFGANRSEDSPSNRPPAAVAPFTSDEARRHQLAWAGHVGKPVRIVSAVGIPLVLIPSGEFMMGARDSADRDWSAPEDDWRYEDPAKVRRQHRPRRRVVLTRPLYFGETEITNRQFRKFVEATGYVTDCERSQGWGKEDRGWVRREGYSWKNLGQRLAEDDLPVINVTWNDAVALCAWLSSHDSLGVFRLPTEAEWEFACRAGSTTMYYFGDDPADLVEHAWFIDTSEGLYRPVGTKQANPFGLYDMYGNRQEWCQDIFMEDFYASSPVNDPLCDTGGTDRVLRGGTHTDQGMFCTSARRWHQDAANPGAAGIRVVCEMKQ